MIRWAAVVAPLPIVNAAAASGPVLGRAVKIAFSSWMRSPWAGVKSVS